MAYIETPSLGQPDWLSELPSWIKRVRELRDEIRARREMTDGVAYNGDFQDRFTALHNFISDCGTSLGRSARELRRIRIRNALEAGNSPASSDTEILNTLTAMMQKCETASHKFLKISWKYDGKELDDIVKLMEKLHGDAKDGDVGLDPLGAHGGRDLVNADGKEAEKPPCEDDAGWI